MNRVDPPDAADPGPWPDWHDDPDPQRDRSTGRTLLVAAAVAPWLVTAALLLRPTGPPAPTAAPASPREAAAVPSAIPTESAANPGAPPGPTVDARVGPPGSATRLSSGARTVAGVGEAAALAVAAARQQLTTVGPPLGAATDAASRAPADTTGTYVEHVAVEAVDFPAAGHVVVTLLAVVLDSAGTSYTNARALRLAVPVALDAGGARVAGTPWALSPPDLAPDPPAWTPVEEPDLLIEAGTAVGAAGYSDVTVHTLHRSSGWPMQVVVSATAPGTDTVAEHRLWLRQHLGALAVAGERPRTDRSDLP